VQIGGLSQVWRLDLSHTSVGDSSVSVLSAMAKLDQLSIDGTRITPSGVQALSKIKPRMHVSPEP
jgi:hypothetical protein